MGELKKLARPEGVEPPTSCLEGSCSIHLSYGRAGFVNSNRFTSPKNTVLNTLIFLVENKNSIAKRWGWPRRKLLLSVGPLPVEERHVPRCYLVLHSMKRRISAIEAVLATDVIIHLVVNVVHGVVHTRARVMISPVAMLFVLTVILIGPIAGLILQRTIQPRGGAIIIAVTMAGAFFFGLANHFLIHGDDNISHVAAAERALFGITAALLLVTEFFGSTLAFWWAAQMGGE